jgi:hypothetical protein
MANSEQNQIMGSKWSIALFGVVMAIVPMSGAPGMRQNVAMHPVAQRWNANAPEVHNIAGDFVTFWDATQGMPTGERVTIFKRTIAPKFPGFYGFARFDGKMTEAQRDGTIARAIEGFGPTRQAYVAKLSGFDRNLARNAAVFTKAFADFRPTTPIWIVNSLGEFDGGTREIDGKTFLLFGIDGMVAFHGTDVRNEAAFFHHELFHVYHRQWFGKCEPIWCSLWREGLATYVASRLNPDATEAELLLTTPDDMAAATRAQLLPSLLALRAVLMLNDDAEYSDLFGFGGSIRSALPQRRGYYLGFLVAKELGRTYDLHALAKMSAVDAQPLVIKAVDRLITGARAHS